MNATPPNPSAPTPPTPDSTSPGSGRLMTDEDMAKLRSQADEWDAFLDWKEARQATYDRACNVTGEIHRALLVLKALDRLAQDALEIVSAGQHQETLEIFSELVEVVKTSLKETYDAAAEIEHALSGSRQQHDQ